MKKAILNILFFLFVSAFSAVSQNIKREIFTCKEGIKDAIIYASNGEYLLISYGLISSITSLGYSDHGFKDFKNKFIYNKYGIKQEKGGCVISQYSDCYRKKTEELLYEKYGEDILVKAKKEAIDLFKETKKYKDNLKDEIESDHVFPSFIVHHKPRFLGGEKQLENYLGKSIDTYRFGKDIDYVEVDFIVEKDGSISNVRLKPSIENKELKNNLKHDILLLFKKMVKWKPAIYFNEKVRVSESIYIVI